jgi:hypothetical protein
MDIGSLLRNSWRITWRHWELWALMLATFVVFFPALVLSGGFGAVAALVTLPAREPVSPWVVRVWQAPVWAWVLAAVAALIVLVLTSALSWLLQAGAMRGIVIAAERDAFPLGEALRLGWQRVINLLTLSVIFSVVVGAIGLLPPLILLLLAGRFAFGPQLMQVAQTALGPVNTVLGIATLLVMMSAALEDVGPAAAFGRAWSVFRSGWWGFLLVFGLTIIFGFAASLVLVPLVLVLVVASFVSTGLGILLAVGACGLLGPIGLALMLFAGVYTQVLYTLIYRAAQPQPPATAGAGRPY